MITNNNNNNSQVQISRGRSEGEAQWQRRSSLRTDQVGHVVYYYYYWWHHWVWVTCTESQHHSVECDLRLDSDSVWHQYSAWSNQHQQLFYPQASVSRWAEWSSGHWSQHTGWEPGQSVSQWDCLSSDPPHLVFLTLASSRHRHGPDQGDSTHQLLQECHYLVLGSNQITLGRKTLWRAAWVLWLQSGRSEWGCGVQGCSVRSTCRLRAGGEAERVLHRSCSHIQREERGADDAGGQVLVCWSVVSTCRENGNNC